MVLFSVTNLLYFIISSTVLKGSSVCFVGIPKIKVGLALKLALAVRAMHRLIAWFCYFLQRIQLWLP